tara:strand:- start:648 stop:1022 length:375 start_codon:yes stop_codon:yes gene_type:complete
MESTSIFLICIAIVILITICATRCLNTQTQENFTTCPDNKFRKQTFLKKDNNKSKNKVIFSEDEDINVHKENPLVPRIVKQPGEFNNWKSFYMNKFLPSSVKEDSNFEGTRVRNYLDSIKYFHN